MIESLTLNMKKKRGILEYSRDIPFLKNTIEFKPGVNILWGKNGSGKSTLINLIAFATFCKRGGVSLVTQTDLGESHQFGFGISDTFLLDWIDIKTNSLPFHYMGELSITNQSWLDDDFLQTQVQQQYTSTSMSSGELINAKLKQKFMTAEEHIEEKIKYTIDKDSVNDLWQKRIENVEEYLKKCQTSKSKLQTILLDEPDRSLDIVNQDSFWNFIKKLNPEKIQVIIATHSIFALNIPGANYITMGDEKYYKDCINILKTINYNA